MGIRKITRPVTDWFQDCWKDWSSNWVFVFMVEIKDVLYLFKMAKTILQKLWCLRKLANEINKVWAEQKFAKKMNWVFVKRREQVQKRCENLSQNKNGD